MKRTKIERKYFYDCMSLAHIIYYSVVTVLMLQTIIKGNVIFKSNTKVVFNDLVVTYWCSQH